MKKLLILLAVFTACSSAFANDTIRFTWEEATEQYVNIGGYGGEFTIDWGDGNVETETAEYYREFSFFIGDTIISGNVYSHVYAEEATYTVTIAGITEDCKFVHFDIGNYNEQIKKIAHLDVSNALELIHLSCDECHLTSVDIGNNTLLQDLDLERNQLKSLDVNNNTELKYLLCSVNQLTSLDVSNHTALKILYCGGNQLANLNINDNLLLKYLQCDFNQLTNLDISNNTLLEELGCSHNQLLDLDLTSLDTLTEVILSNNHFPLNILYAASVITDDGWSLLGPQNLLPVNIMVGNTYGEGQNEFGGIYTEYVVLKSDSTTSASSGIDYSVTNGMISFLVQDTFYVKMTNAAIISNEEYPAEVYVKIIAGEAVGTEEIADDEEIRVYPNPTSSIVNIDGIDETSEVSVYSASGRLMERSFGKHIDLSKQPAGVYLLKVGNKTARVVKK